jgi:peroxiredoxin
VALGLAFLLIGALRALRVWGWRLEQIEITLSRRLGLPPGTKARAFTLPSVQGARAVLKSFAGRRVLLVFTKSDGHPWQQLLTELNRLQQRGDVQVLLIETGGPEPAKQLAGEGQAAFPVLVLETPHLVKRYHVPAMPFAFLIDEQGMIRAKGIVSNAQHLEFLLGEARKEPAAPTPSLPSPLDTFVFRADDIFIVTYPRSGTTWMQMILYQLTTEGKMDFPHITTVSPWFERSLKDGKAYDALPSPRVFKSHLSYRKIPKRPCKYIYVARDGKDVAVSYHHFQKTHMGYKGTFDEFFERFLKGADHYGSWFRHVRGWWEHRHDPNVLFLYYEELAEDLPSCLRRISDFCGLEIAPERWNDILERCSFAFMKQHERQFDPMTAMLYEQGFQPNSHLRKGQTGSGSEQLSLRQSRRFDKTFSKRLGGTGLDFAPAAPLTKGALPCCVLATPSAAGGTLSR